MNLNTVAALLAQSCQINAEITGVCIDSRELKPGSLFIAIQGDRFDGHDFINEAEAQGALAAVVKYALTVREGRRATPPRRLRVFPVTNRACA